MQNTTMKKTKGLINFGPKTYLIKSVMCTLILLWNFEYNKKMKCSIFANLKTKKNPLLQKTLKARMYDVWSFGVVINLKQNAKIWNKVPKGNYHEFSLNPK